jgi:FKBP-type peptidyl-prolyl cis-trans isomerase
MVRIQDALSGAKPLMTPEETNKSLVELKNRILAAEQATPKKEGEENLSKGKAFLEENGEKEGVTSLPSRLQYRVVKEGTGAMPSLNDTVKVRYRGTLLDGTEFDSSYSRGEPLSLKPN